MAVEQYKELYESEIGQAFLKAEEVANSANIKTFTNQIGQEMLRKWNPKTFTEQIKSEKTGKIFVKNPYAEIISAEFDKMVVEVFPKEAFLSRRLQNWITKEHNELLIDPHLSSDKYSKKVLEVEFEKNGILDKPNKMDIMREKINYLQKELGRIKQAFTTFKEKNPNEIYESKENLEKWTEYYAGQIAKVNNSIKNGDFSDYDRTNKEGEIYKVGTLEDAKTHKENLENKQHNLVQQLENATNEIVNKQESEIPDYASGNVKQEEVTNLHKPKI